MMFSSKQARSPGSLGVVAAAKHGRFGPLDGLRGVGALSVVIYHAWPLSTQTCGLPSCNASFEYLAVDLFFILSGFVISYSYDQRFIAGMTFWQFMRARIVRLYPIFFICVLFGSLPFIWYALNGQGSRGRFLVTFATNIFMLPSPTYPVQPDPFPLVSPAWSLFFEIFVANVSYGLIWKKLTNQLLGWIIGLSLLVLFGVIGTAGTIDGGSLWKTFPIGFPRVIYAFYVGVALHRIFLLRKPPSIPSFVILMLVAASFWPRLHGWYAPTYELLCIVIFYPVLIYLGASARERMPQVGKLIGEISYALYLVHIPILLMVLDVTFSFGINSKGLLATIAFIAVSLGVAFALSFYYDRPARAFLGKLISRRS